MRKSVLFITLNFFISYCYSQDHPYNSSKDSLHTDSSMLDEIKDDVLDNIPTISLDENDFSESGSQNISSLLTAGRDPFYNAATFNFSAERFRIRGYDADLSSTYMNGIPTESIDNGFTPYNLWSGLNDVLHNRD